MADSNKELQKMLQNKSIKFDTISKSIKHKYLAIHLTPQTLGMLFERYANIEYNADDPPSCFGKEITIEELAKLHPDFQSTNGCQWARSDNSYLGKKVHYN